MIRLAVPGAFLLYHESRMYAYPSESRRFEEAAEEDEGNLRVVFEDVVAIGGGGGGGGDLKDSRSVSLKSIYE